MSPLELSRLITMISGIWFIAAWFFLSFVVAYLAKEKGRSGFGFFVLSIIFSPLMGSLLAILAGENKQKMEAAMMYEGVLEPCPQCMGAVNKVATKCRHCGSEI